MGHAPVDIERFLANPAQTRFTWLYPKSARSFLADPFGVERGGKLFILAERLVYGQRKGELVFIDARAGTIEPLLARPFHLSYPFIVVDEGTTYVAPEQSERNQLCFYRLDGHSLGEPVAAIDGLDAIDPTFLRHGGRWWLFCTRASASSASLHLFYADHLFGPYRPHPDNPVVTDAARARPAGRIVRLGTRLLRPGQDCRKSYGAAITLSEIEELTETRYRERPLQRIEPYLFAGAFREGVHTLDHTANHVLIDSKRHVFHPLAFAFKLWDRRARPG